MRFAPDWSSRRWTEFDSLAALCLIVMLLRVSGPGDPAEASETLAGLGDLPGSARTEPAPPTVDPVIAAVARPLLGAGKWIAKLPHERIDGVLRCIGLTEARARIACRAGTGPDCLRARNARAEMERGLWPKGRSGQLATRLIGGVEYYARAYAALGQRPRQRHDTPPASITARDNAMCKEYVKRG